MKERETTLNAVLANPSQPGRDVHLFLPANRHWSHSVPALVVDLDESDEELEDVERRTGFQYAMPLSAVRQIAENARHQLRAPTPDELLRAFRFYYDHDAFVDFTSSPN